VSSLLKTMMKLSRWMAARLHSGDGAILPLGRGGVCGLDMDTVEAALTRQETAPTIATVEP
jgi:hypothetical protein